MRTSGPQPGELNGYEVVVAVCGGIAAYKVAGLVSALAQKGASVTVAMTEAARQFVGPATFAALCNRPVLTSLWTEEASADPQHIRLTEALDLLLVAPATYNIIGKIRAGIADDVVTTLISAAGCPVLLAPAMNTRMWSNPINQRNVRDLKELGYRFIDPQEGWLACRTVGAGRMAEPEAITSAVVEQLRSASPVSKSGSE